jgi:hypothetical protein
VKAIAKFKMEINARKYSSGEALDERDIEEAVLRGWAIKQYDVPEIKPAQYPKARARMAK